MKLVISGASSKKLDCSSSFARSNFDARLLASVVDQLLELLLDVRPVERRSVQDSESPW